MKLFLLASVAILLTGVSGLGQLPPVGTIDFFGLGKNVTSKDISSVLTIKEGDDAMKSMIAVEKNRELLKLLPGVEDASIGLVCCDDILHQSIIFVGIREKGTPGLSFRKAPAGAVRLPDSIIQIGKEFDTAFLESVKGQNFGEDDSQGHAFFSDPKVQAIQKHFPGIADKNLKILRRVLHESSDAAQRALAAEIIAYSSNKKEIIGDLLYGMNDPDSKVRNNSMRALIILSDYSQKNPNLGLKIPTLGFVRMLNSLDWTDRNKSTGVLVSLTKKRDPALLKELKKEALPSLIEMAKWKSPGHSQGSFFILGRLADVADPTIAKMWLDGNHRESIDSFVKKINSNPVGR